MACGGDDRTLTDALIADELLPEHTQEAPLTTLLVSAI